jgi:hypothetical protein
VPAACASSIPLKKAGRVKVALLRLVRTLIRRLQISVCIFLLLGLDPVQICGARRYRQTLKTIYDFNPRMAD